MYTEVSTESGSTLERRSLSRESCGLVGNSVSIQRMTAMLAKVAKTDSTVLILGESGTGKEVIARCLHQHSLRNQGPFVAVNCGAIPEELMESELFGHEKGAFTGALAARKGRFELAEGGTLFLDEIAEMSPQMQVKLLRVLQEKQFERVGGARVLESHVRIVAATHRNLETRIQEGNFREDLYYRLNVFPVHVPPLRDRPGDIHLLFAYFMDKLTSEGHLAVTLEGDSLRTLDAYHWPGNVRELHNLAERLVILHGGETLSCADLPVRMRSVENAGLQDERQSLAAVWAEPSGNLPEPPFDLKLHLEEIEKEFLLQALAMCDQVVARAAERLGLRRTTMVEKLKKYGLNTIRDMDH
ncbi:sigma-54-dependent Fis family transcriptional regulator [Acidithiobacillus sp.]|uniref:sigma-54 interaction domain-containing protein n=1 Tax=Acidithiobacillus sp. TaxID=1872118 RepID=UPI00260301DF|nr:sigma-54 dependent transcriptional regulator [Acidithiobacillus sp.]MDD2748478.1 sigma-54 dependent transcriptional regulator [Acidithiobacillus sp.]MDD5278237.1 sigma-54 dependent transcriptional regulator [Acidithiobacillus sp.]